MLAGVFIGIAAIAMFADWWAVRTDSLRVETFAKPSVMVALIAIALLVEPTPSSLRPWIVAGLVLGLVGDVFLLPQIDLFIAGLASFLVGHAAYLVVLASIWVTSGWLAVGVVGAAALLLGFGIPIVRGVADSRLAPTVIAYIGITAAIIVVGSGTGRMLVVAGSLAFATSDGLLGSNRFVRPAPDRRVWIHVLYHLGQSAILAGVLTA